MLFSLALLSLPAGAVVAQPVSGPYVAGSIGLNFRPPQTITPAPETAPPALEEQTPSPQGLGTGSLGYGFGNGWRLELEGGRRR